MKLRRAMLIASTAAIALLAVLAVVGAFLGAERAAILFNSLPAAALWMVLLVLTTAGAATLAVRRRFGWAVVHVGAAVVLVGGMVGSPAGHRVVSRLTGRCPVRDGVMVLGVGETSDRLVSGERLPFAVTVRDAWTEYHDPPSVLVLTGDARAGPVVPEQGALALDDGTTIRIVEHLPHARGAYADDVPGALAVFGRDDREAMIAAEPGAATALADPAVRVRIVAVYRNPRLTAGGELIDREGPRVNPAVHVAITRPDGTTVETLVFARPAPPSSRLPEGLRLRYLLAEGPIAVADAASHHPAVQVAIARDGRRRRAWLLADPDWNRNVLTDDDLPAVDLGDRRLQLAQLPGTAPATDYKTDLAVSRDGRVVAEAVIEMNHPLHVGGFHLYQPAFDRPAPAVVVLAVHSDLGVSVVWAGFALLCGGVAWAAWIAPLRRRR
ncbi:MAG: hypothetical protein ACOC7R_04285 [Planctomycetota bacterium]